MAVQPVVEAPGPPGRRLKLALRPPQHIDGPADQREHLRRFRAVAATAWNLAKVPIAPEARHASRLALPFTSMTT